MSRLITSTFAIVGVFVGFVSGLFFTFYALNLHDGDEAIAMSLAFGAAIVFALLFGWGAGVVRDRMPEKYRDAFGSVGLVLALASTVYFFSSIK